jgi:hypothetical protein
MALAVPAKEPSTPSGMEIARVMAPAISTENLAVVIATVVLEIAAILNAPQKRAWVTTI